MALVVSIAIASLVCITVKAAFFGGGAKSSGGLWARYHRRYGEIAASMRRRRYGDNMYVGLQKKGA